LPRWEHAPLVGIKCAIPKPAATIPAATALRLLLISAEIEKLR